MSFATTMKRLAARWHVCAHYNDGVVLRRFDGQSIRYDRRGLFITNEGHIRRHDRRAQACNFLRWPRRIGDLSRHGRERIIEREYDDQIYWDNRPTNYDRF